MRQLIDKELIVQEKRRFRNLISGLSALRKRYVPVSGPAETKGGEIIRALDYIIYEYFTDGIAIGDRDGEDVTSSYDYILVATIDPNDKSRYAGMQLDWTVVDFMQCRSDEEYLEMLYDMAGTVIDWINNHDARPDNVFEVPNKYDSRRYTASDKKTSKERGPEKRTGKNTNDI